MPYLCSPQTGISGTGIGINGASTLPRDIVSGTGDTITTRATTVDISTIDSQYDDRFTDVNTVGDFY